MTLPEDALTDFIEQTMAHGSKSFARAARLFDAPTRRSALELYAWCRHCDDVIDGQTLGHDTQSMSAEERARCLDALRADTLRALSNAPVEHPAFEALRRVAARHAIPARYPLELIEGFAMDVEGHTYRTREDVLLYCYHVAGVVGVMMAHIMGVRDPETLQRAADLGIAFQLTNICRDVMEDAAHGRVYLPTDWLAEHQLTRDNLTDPAQRQNVHDIARRLLAEAEPYYASAHIGIRQLPYRSAWAIATAHSVYRGIGVKLLAGGPEAWNTRITTSRRRKLVYVAQSALRAGVAVCARPLPTPQREPLWSREAAA
jgi:phytoene synthase